MCQIFKSSTSLGFGQPSSGSAILPPPQKGQAQSGKGGQEQDQEASQVCLQEFDAAHLLTCRRSEDTTWPCTPLRSNFKNHSYGEPCMIVYCEDRRPTGSVADPVPYESDVDIPPSSSVRMRTESFARISTKCPPAAVSSAANRRQICATAANCEAPHACSMATLLPPSLRVGGRARATRAPSTRAAPKQ